MRFRNNPGGGAKVCIQRHRTASGSIWRLSDCVLCDRNDLTIPKRGAALAAAAYKAAQLAGGLLGMLLAHAMFEHPLLKRSTAPALASRSPKAPRRSHSYLPFSPPGARPDAVAWAVALVILAGHWWTASTSVANPAATLARSLADTFFGIRPAGAPGLILAQLTGDLAALGASALLFDRRANA